MIKYRPEAEKYKLGEILDRQVSNSMTFKFGIEPEINHSITEKLSTSSPLYIGKDSLQISTTDGFYFLKMILSYPDGLEMRNISISGDENLINETLNGNFDFTNRENHEITLTIDQKVLFSLINVISDNENEINEKLIKNLDNSFKL